MPAFSLGPEKRRELRSRLSRNWTLRVSREDRAIVRQVFADLDAQAPGSLAGIRIIPISSLEWTSELRVIGGTPIIVFDTEQANALNFMCVRHISRDRPMFHYVEHAIRAGELLLSLGEFEAALRVARMGQHRLREYARHHHSEPALPRPMSVGGVIGAHSMVATGLVPSFLLGHEIGHYLTDYSTHLSDTFAMVAELWEKLSVDDQGEVSFTRFVHPAHLQKLDDAGEPGGHVVMGSHMMAGLKLIQSRMISESQADYVGLLAATLTAMRHEVPPAALLETLHVAMEAMEQQLLVRQISVRLPRRPETGAVMIDASRLGSRLRIMYEMIRLLAAGDIGGPGINAYWKDLPERERLEDPVQLDRITMAAGRSNIVSRGAIYYGLGGSPPSKLYSPEEAHSKFGILAGNMMAISAPFRAPPEFYDIASQADWMAQGQVLDPGLAGFAGAMRDMTQALVHPERTDAASGYLWDITELSLEAALEQVRQARITVQRESVGAAWPYESGAE